MNGRLVVFSRFVAFAAEALEGCTWDFSTACFIANPRERQCFGDQNNE
jgi:hypothetical protein